MIKYPAESEKRVCNDEASFRRDEMQVRRVETGRPSRTNVEPTTHAAPRVNATRPDQVRPSLPHDDALRNAPAQANGLFMVPKIVE